MSKLPTNGEIITRFQNNYDVNASDYRPLGYGLHDIKYGMEQRPGITVYCENGDIILYFPNCKDYPQGGNT